jgi:NAD(P)-dependent dehydrogenase (short-subunit alcohol dehydrogenase family)
MATVLIIGASRGIGFETVKDGSAPRKLWNILSRELTQAWRRRP